ncbi:transcriptional regulator [Longispora fulva]|uniref:Transcriptional regulator with XRE-family HTH domain n=1 Tax=Longispora fulva TaxID=619741 RepID=A0A8J7GLT8_9ACTN|nr:helix-turn-helix transcriptional regulator [Longispora fulva]MBG6140621.1 transcriptional regulator with XRE-family HTH domain [Longispora fulva]GIG56997.1 transcriptional regulator [Longispora fulva]
MAKRDKTKDIPLRAQWLGAALYELRDTACLTLSDVSDYLGKNAGTISRFESGEYPIQSPDLLKLLDLYRVTDRKQRGNLLHHCEEIGVRGWWDGYATYYDRTFIDLVWLEQRAEAIRQFSLLNIPGLLQTRGHMETLFRNGPHRDDEELNQRAIELRTSRQLVFEKPNPPRLDVILHESVLHHRVGSTDIVREQLNHLADLPPHFRVRLRVLPLADWEPSKAGAVGPFSFFELVAPYPDVAQVETLSGNLYVESPESEKFDAVYDQIWRVCLDEAASRDLIRETAEGLTDDGDRSGHPGKPARRPAVAKKHA